MLDTLASKRALEEAEASGEGEEDGSKSGRKKKGPLLDGNSFNLISLEVVKNNDLKLDGENVRIYGINNIPNGILAVTQVWPVTQFYSVDFSQSS